MINLLNMIFQEKIIISYYRMPLILITTKIIMIILHRLSMMMVNYIFKYHRDLKIIIKISWIPFIRIN